MVTFYIYMYSKSNDIILLWFTVTSGCNILHVKLSEVKLCCVISQLLKIGEDS